MPDFQNPYAFLLLLLIPLLFLLRKLKVLNRVSFFYTVSDWNGNNFGWNKKIRNFFFWVSRIVFVLAYVSFVIAFAKPVIYRQERVYTSRGTDIIFVLDVSPSMAARDFNGNRRIDVSKQAISDLVKSNSGVSYGLVAMAGEAAILIPPTMDHKLFLENLNSCAIGSLGDGTALGTGLSCAVYHLASSSAPKKCIIIVTDGENNAGAIHPETAANLASKKGITVYTLGVGTSGSVPIDYVDPKTGKNYSGYLNSSFDSNALKQIALSGGGRYFEIRSMNDLSLALTLISRNENTVQTYHTKTTGKNYYDKMILISLVLTIFGWIIRRLYLQEYV